MMVITYQGTLVTHGERTRITGNRDPVEVIYESHTYVEGFRITGE